MSRWSGNEKLSLGNESVVLNGGLSGHGVVRSAGGYGNYRKEQTGMDENSLLDVRGAAALLGISPGTLYHWLSEGRVNCVRLGPRCVRFRKRDLEEWISQKTVGTKEAQIAARSSTFTGERRRR